MLQTKRLTLRGPHKHDLDDMFAIFSNRQAMRYWSTPPHADILITQDMLDRRLAIWPDIKLYFQIEMDGRMIGCTGSHASGEVGFILHPDFWRQGIISEAMHTVIPYLFDVTDYPALTADADPDNAASVGILKSLGFHETHRAKNTFCIDGVWSDSVYFALPRPQ